MARLLISLYSPGSAGGPSPHAEGKRLHFSDLSSSHEELILCVGLGWNFWKRSGRPLPLRFRYHHSMCSVTSPLPPTPPHRRAPVLVVSLHPMTTHSRLAPTSLPNIICCFPALTAMLLNAGFLPSCPFCPIDSEQSIWDNFLKGEVFHIPYFSWQYGYKTKI